ncbi:hypothetical protein [Thiosocius teredinicola]|uniref:hypothetical protein n=1 Tax=Thiosocius teredinicola TaxID=1973002 RepID=UPI0009914A1C
MIKNRVYIIFEVIIGFFPILMFLVWGSIVWPGTVAMVIGGTAGMFETAVALGVPLGVLGAVGVLILTVEVSYEDGEPYRYPRTTLLFVLFGIAAAVLAGSALFFDGGWYSLVVVVPLMITAQLLWLGRKKLWSSI